MKQIGGERGCCGGGGGEGSLSCLLMMVRGAAGVRCHGEEEVGMVRGKGCSW